MTESSIAIEPTPLDPMIDSQSPNSEPSHYKKTAQLVDWTHWTKQIIFLGVHVMALLVFWVGFSWVALFVCVFNYIIRMFAITGGYHRYFSHRSYQTSRWFQFVLGLLGTSCAQKGPIWWASHHRHHHQFSDTPEDIHSPRQQGIWWAHIGWVISPAYLDARPELVKDLLKFPEIKFLDDYHLLAPIVLGVAMFGLGVLLEALVPSWGTNGLQMLIWGFFLSTALLYHGTFLVNSATHLIGKQRFKTGDDSRNSLIIALLTLGEGWHNNHHRYPGAEPQGMYWWEIDISHYILRTLAWFGIVWDLRRAPERIYKEATTNGTV